MSVIGMPSVMQTIDLDAGVGGFHDGVGRETPGGTKMMRGVGAGFLDGLGHGVEDGEALVLVAALAGRHAADDVGAVVHHLLGVERALGAGDALHDEARIFVNENAQSCLSSKSANGPRRLRCHAIPNA